MLSAGASSAFFSAGASSVFVSAGAWSVFVPAGAWSVVVPAGAAPSPAGLGSGSGLACGSGVTWAGGGWSATVVGAGSSAWATPPNASEATVSAAAMNALLVIRLM